jgi:peptide/nickel transport system substrate-binding protein
MKRSVALSFAACFAVAALASAADNTLHFAIRADPKTLDPLMVTEEAADTVRYLTHAPLVRLQRKTQQPEAALATSWKVLTGGTAIRFDLRPGVKFSTGEPFDSADVAYTFARLLDPEKKLPAGEPLRTSTKVTAVETPAPLQVIIRFAAPVADLIGLFDELPIVSRSGNARAGLGPFLVESHEPGSNLKLVRNPNYWKRDEKGRRLPYLDALRIDIQQNRDLEMARFTRGDLDLINDLDAELYDRLKTSDPRAAVEGGPTLDAEMLWFNLSNRSPLAPYKRAWFQSTAFRQAISLAISRESIVKLVYRGAAEPAFGPISPASKTWANPSVIGSAKPDLAAAKKRLASAGFVLKDGHLRDAAGNAVEFSLVTNAGNKTRARISALVEQDLAALGIKLNIVTLDMPSVVERLMKSLDYEACLLGLVGVDLDPADQANLWMSSSTTHQFNPGSGTAAKPDTAWEAAIDEQMRIITAEANPARRKKAVFQLQEIAAREQPLIYLAHRHALMAASPALTGLEPVALRPRLLWNIERLSFRTNTSEKR